VSTLPWSTQHHICIAATNSPAVIHRRSEARQKPNPSRLLHRRQVHLLARMVTVVRVIFPLQTAKAVHVKDEKRLSKSKALFYPKCPDRQKPYCPRGKTFPLTPYYWVYACNLLLPTFTRPPPFKAKPSKAPLRQVVVHSVSELRANHSRSLMTYSHCISRTLAVLARTSPPPWR
jgi:hypothetical protein